MPRHAELIELDVDGDAALRACREALLGSGWEITEEGPGALRAREDPCRLDCRTSPSQLEVTALDLGGDTTSLSVAATAPGIGPIPGPGRLRRQIAALRARMDAATAGHAT
jgi:hypothetical protein